MSCQHFLVSKNCQTVDEKITYYNKCRKKSLFDADNILVNLKVFEENPNIESLFNNDSNQ